MEDNDKDCDKEEPEVQDQSMDDLRKSLQALRNESLWERFKSRLDYLLTVTWPEYILSWFVPSLGDVDPFRWPTQESDDEYDLEIGVTLFFALGIPREKLGDAYISRMSLPVRVKAKSVLRRCHGDDVIPRLAALLLFDEYRHRRSNRERSFKRKLVESLLKDENEGGGRVGLRNEFLCSQMGYWRERGIAASVFNIVTACSSWIFTSIVYPPTGHLVDLAVVWVLILPVVIMFERARHIDRVAMTEIMEISLELEN